MCIRWDCRSAFRFDKIIHSHRAIARCFGLGLFRIWHLASHTGNLPILGNLSRGGPQSFYNFWQVAKISWHAANSTPPDPPWSWIVPHISYMTKIGPEKAYFHGYLTLTFDLNLPQIIELAMRYIGIPKLRPLGPLAAAGVRVTHGRKARKYMMM